jgi:hypothetical protein
MARAAMPPGAGAGAAVSSADLRLTGSANARTFVQNHGTKMALTAWICERRGKALSKTTRMTKKQAEQIEQAGEILRRFPFPAATSPRVY